MKKSAIRKTLAVLLALLLLLPLFPASAIAIKAEDTIELTNAPPNVTAQAAIVMDYETGDVLWGRDIDTGRAPASMTKNMTAFIVYEEIAAGRLSFDTMIPISPNAERISRQWDWGGRYVRAGNAHSVETLLRLIMLPSHNGACIAVAEYISGSEAAFVTLMNETAARLGINAAFGDAFGASPGNRISARAMATLVRVFIQTHPDILRITQMTSFTFAGGHTPNTNLLLPGNSFFTQGADGFKTGTGAAAGHCLSATAMRDGRRVITVVMNAPNNNGRYGDTRALFNFGFAELERRDTSLHAITIRLSADMQTVRRNADFMLTAQLENVNTGSFTVRGGSWIMNGETVYTLSSFTPQTHRTFSLTHHIPADSVLAELEVEFSITLPNGDQTRASLTLPVSSEAPALFRDINGHWAEADIERAVERGLFSGVGEGRFAPNSNMTRGMFVTVLGRMARQMGLPVHSSGEAPFADVPSGVWFTDYVAWAWEQGLVQGVGENRFGTDNHITRQEVAVLFYRFMQHYDLHLPDVPGPNSFPDADQIADWAYDAMWAAVRGGLITGFADGRLAPTHTATRAQLATMFLRFMNRTAGDPPPDQYSCPGDLELSVPDEPEDLPEDEWEEENTGEEHEVCNDLASPLL